MGIENVRKLFRCEPPITNRAPSLLEAFEEFARPDPCTCFKIGDLVRHKDQSKDKSIGRVEGFNYLCWPRINWSWDYPNKLDHRSRPHDPDELEVIPPHECPPRQDKCSRCLGTFRKRCYRCEQKQEQDCNQSSMFQVGDFVNTPDGAGKIIIVDGEYVGVEFAHQIPCGHDLEKRTKPKHGWWFLLKDITKID